MWLWEVVQPKSNVSPHWRCPQLQKLTGCLPKIRSHHLQSHLISLIWWSGELTNEKWYISTSMTPMATKRDSMVTSNKGSPPREYNFNHMVSWGLETNEKLYMSLPTKPVAIKHERAVAFNQWSLTRFWHKPSSHGHMIFKMLFDLIIINSLFYIYLTGFWKFSDLTNFQAG